MQVISTSESSSFESFVTDTVDPVVPPTEPQGVLKDIVIDTASLGDDANSPITMALHGIIPTIDSYDSNGYILSHAPVYEF